jgi:serine/threonine protein kinase
MSPEQARGDLEHMDERSDVFSLGAILCEILTGLPAYVSADGEVMDLAREADTSRALARVARCGAARELKELASRCLSPEPASRPANARIVAEQVGGYLTAVEVRVRPVSAARRFRVGMLVAIAIRAFAYSAIARGR